MERFEAIIVGAGPGGLACARILAAGGCRVLVLEHGRDIGAKVCAGGVTWDGLIQRIPESLFEAVFSRQDVFTPWQQVVVREKIPMVATVDRRRLGRWMADQAIAAGAELRLGTVVSAVEGRVLSLRRGDGITRLLSCDHLVGADGSASLVRRSLGLSSRRLGVGIHAQLPGQFPQMEWHLDPRLFGSGYAWVFPHRDTASVGAYGLRAAMDPLRLQRAFGHWAGGRNIDLTAAPLRAALVNCDYQGHHFGNTWLVGDAAGLASGLTGEGIFPALLSGEVVAETILGSPQAEDVTRRLAGLVRRQRLHHRVQDYAREGGYGARLLLEGLVLMLRLRLLRFSALEMAN
ncbi:MAG: hypothetical protein BWK76_04245 [Desulfobulbaceae bacterium A2]|nr:MAG: hypothetical protein BWK76_04245 [Desulfobulbaceae bacterium A2]